MYKEIRLKFKMLKRTLLFFYLLIGLIISCSSSDSNNSTTPSSKQIVDAGNSNGDDTTNLPKSYVPLRCKAPDCPLFFLPELEYPVGRLTCDSPDAGYPFACHGIDYNGGPVMGQPLNVYLLWYGSWENEDTKKIVEEFVINLSDSDLWTINTDYCDNNHNCVSRIVNLAGTTSIAKYINKPQIGQDDIIQIVQDSITHGILPRDTNGSYLVLTSKEISVLYGCSSVCGYHDVLITEDQGTIKYGYIEDPSQCVGNCDTFNSDQIQNPPNNNLQADGMVSIIFHELSETVTDPELTGWYKNDQLGKENGDLCAWQFGNTYTPAGNPGTTANVKLGARDYMVQMDWVNRDDGFCAIKRQFKTIEGGAATR